MLETMNRYSRKSSLSKTFKDYLVPFVGIGLIIILMYSFFMWGSSTDSGSGSLENRVWSTLVLSGTNPEAYIVYTGDKKETITENRSIYKWEKLIVKEGQANISSPNNSRIAIDRLGEFKLNEDGTYALYSSNIWVESFEAITVHMRYATVKIENEAVVSMTQNEVWSTIYVLKGSVGVSNIAWVSTLLWKWQKITISRSDASSEDIDIVALKGSIDSFFESSDWFIQNKGEVLLNQTEVTASWSTATGSVTQENWKSFLSFSNFEDESSVDSENINISGSFSGETIVAITANGIPAKLNTDTGIFLIEWVPTQEKENDIVVKVYNSSKEVIEKRVFTVYYAAAASESKTPFQVENYSLDATEFQFISPKQNPYTTSEDVVMIEGRVPAGIVKQIIINEFTLQKFPQYGTYWAYFANKEFGNLKDGLNIYKVEYYDENGKVLHSNAFTIVHSSANSGDSSWSGTTIQ